MSSESITIPNFKKIEELLSSINDEFDMESRLNRYHTLTPELIEFANELGLTDADKAVYALFISDFIITSSEVPPGITDEERRKSIILTFKEGLDRRNDDASVINSIFYLAQKLYVSLKRNDSFLAGRGIDAETRKIILVDMYLTSYFMKTKTLLREGPINWEVGILHSMVEQQLPHITVNSYLEIEDINSDDVFAAAWTIIDDFVKRHNAEVNSDSPLPNVSNSSAILLTKTENDWLTIAGSNLKSKTSAESIQLGNNLLNYLDTNDSTYSLISMRGDLVDSTHHLVMVRHPASDNNPLVLFNSPVSDINLTEINEILKLRSNQTSTTSPVISPITETSLKQVEQEVEEVVEDVVEKEVEVGKSKADELKEIPKKKGLWGKIKSIFIRSSDKKNAEDTSGSQTESKMVQEKVERTIKRTVLKNVEEKELVGYQLPDTMAYSLGVYAFEDFRMFEKFDTLRETEYQIIGALKSDFVNNYTEVLSIDAFDNSDEIFNLLDGLDEVIEEFMSYYLAEDIQLLPKEMFFVSYDERYYLLTFEGNKEGLVATIAKTYEKDLTNWQNKKQVEIVQRRTLQMRTNQLLSATVHTPFDTAVKRIYGDALDTEYKIDKLEHAILTLD